MSPAHILVVNDKSRTANSLSDLLSLGTGHKVTQAANGQEATKLLSQAARSASGPVDLVVIDNRVPSMSGREVFSWLRAHPSLSYTRVITLGASGADVKVDALAAGADDFIVKPFQASELLVRVSAILRAQRLEKQLRKQSDQLSALNRVSNAITTTLDIRQILAAAVAGARAILDMELAAIIFLEREAGQLRCRAVDGDSSNPFIARPTIKMFRPIVPGQGVIGRAFSSNSMTVVNDPLEDSAFMLDSDAPSGITVRNLLVLPLEVRGKPIGLLVAFNKTTGPLTEVDTDLFASLGGAVSRAIENAMLFRRVKDRQEELQKSHNLLQAVMDGILHPIYTIDADWRLMSINKNKADELATPPERLAGRVCYEALFNRAAPCDDCLAAQTLRDQEARHWSTSWLDEGRLPQEWDIHAYPIPGSSAASASSTRAVVVWQDRTEERRLENSLLQADKLAAIGQLAAGVAHELNNPLTVINANAEMLKMFIPPEDENYESVELIARAGERAANVIQNLLDFARQNQYTFKLGDLNSSIEQALQLVAYQFDEANFVINCTLPTELPHIQASWEHLKTVWLNLLLNARDALDEGPATDEPGIVTIVTQLAPDGKWLRVLFGDNGAGMTEAQKAHIFEPFYTTKDPGRGTGLGLATSHRIIEQHGGQVELFSKLGKGSTFIVHLPTPDNGISLPQLQIPGET